jgi:hypothetical protein
MFKAHAVDITVLDNTVDLTDPPISSGTLLTVTSHVAKIFTVGSTDAVMKQIDLAIQSGPIIYDETILFHLYAVDANKNPTGVSLGSYSEIRSYSTNPLFASYETTMNGFVMQAGTTYALVANSLGTQLPTVLFWTVLNSNNPYATEGGWTFDETRISTDAGNQWSVSPLSHGMKITVSTVPEPSTLSTAFIAFATFTLIRFGGKKRKSVSLIINQTERSRV